VVGGNIPAERITALDAWIRENPRPDLTLLLDLPGEVGLTRLKRNAPQTRIRYGESSFQEQIRAAYLTRAVTYPKRFRVVYASRPLPEVKMEVSRILEEWLYGRAKKGKIEFGSIGAIPVISVPKG
jgi:dTMP kinase